MALLRETVISSKNTFSVFLWSVFPVSIEIYLQFLDYRKFWAHSFLYFILTLLNSEPTPKFDKPTRLLVQVYITFYSLNFKLMNIIL